MSDFLDVMHFLFEEDMKPMEEDVRKSRDHLRRSLYVDMYGSKEYSWGSSHSESSGRSGDSAYTRTYEGTDVDNAVSFEKTKLSHKSYTPPTPVDVDNPLPFGNVLDAPLG